MAFIDQQCQRIMLGLQEDIYRSRISGPQSVQTTTYSREKVKELKIQKSDLYKTIPIHYLNPAAARKIMKRRNEGGWMGDKKRKQRMPKPSIFHFLYFQREQNITLLKPG